MFTLLRQFTESTYIAFRKNIAKTASQEIAFVLPTNPQFTGRDRVDYHDLKFEIKKSKPILILPTRNIIASISPQETGREGMTDV
jgi:hypothetical protein